MLFKHPTPFALAKKQLQDAQREKLENERAAEYFQAMADMLANRILRLTNAIEEMESVQTPD